MNFILYTACKSVRSVEKLDSTISKDIKSLRLVCYFNYYFFIKIFVKGPRDLYHTQTNILCIWFEPYKPLFDSLMLHAP